MMRRIAVLAMSTLLVAVFAKPAAAATRPYATFHTVIACFDVASGGASYTVRVDFVPASKKATTLSVSAYDPEGALLDSDPPSGWALARGIDLTPWMSGVLQVGAATEFEVVFSLHFMVGKDATKGGKLWTEVGMNCSSP